MDLFWDSLRIRLISMRFGRYDVMMIPKIKETKKYPAIIMEFKVRNIKREEIHHYGFAFEGKKVLIG